MEDVIRPWSSSLGIDLSKISVMRERGGEFVELSVWVKHIVRTDSYSPQANGAIERRHKDLAAYCRLYEIEPPQAAELVSKIQVNAVTSRDLQEGDLFLRYVKRIQSKDKDRWTGPYITLKKVGNKMIEALNLET